MTIFQAMVVGWLAGNLVVCVVCAVGLVVHLERDRRREARRRKILEN